MSKKVFTGYLLAAASEAVGAVLGWMYVKKLFDDTDFVGFGRGFIPMMKLDMDVDMKIMESLTQKEKEGE